MTRLAGTLLAVTSALVAFGLHPVSALAGDPPAGSHYTTGGNKGSSSYSSTVTSSNQGVWIIVHGKGSESGSSGAPVSSSGGSAGPGSSTTVSYSSSGSVASAAPGKSWSNNQGQYYQAPDGTTYQITPVNVSTGAASGGWFSSGTQQHPGTVPEALYINGKFAGIVWVPIGNGTGNVHLGVAGNGSGNGTRSAAVVIDPRAVALEVLRHIPLPDIRVRVNPALGMVAVPGWFWAEGYDGRPFGGSVTVGTYTVSVQIQPTSYTWTFGDGSTLVSVDLGQAYPAESDIQHTYQYSSLHFPQGFPVQLTIQFAASYSVNGGPAQGLAAMARTYTAGYRVQELQSILTGQ